MIHIKDLLAKFNENASKRKFYHHNAPIFLKYFDSEQQYRALLEAGNFEKIRENIAKNSTFSSEEFFKTLTNE